jgi:hypothetical protein
MYCISCGSRLDGRSRCPTCGRVFDSSAYPDRLASHLGLVSVLWCAFGALRFLLSALFYFLAQADFVGRETGWLFVPVVFHVLSAVLFLKAVFSLAVGWGLQHREAWARMLGLVMGILALPILPLGTALGVYALWVLLPRESESSYQRLSHAA